MFHFWKIEVWTGSTLDKFMCVVVKVESKVKERAWYGGIVDCDARFVEVPSSRAVIQKWLSMKRTWGGETNVQTYRTMRTAGLSVNLYFFPPTSKSIWRLIASRRLIWPLIKLENVGALESLTTVKFQCFKKMNRRRYLRNPPWRF